MVENYQMNITQNIQQDLRGLPSVSQGRRLDADEYWAEDIDGGTESVFSSGNMAFSILQASQLNPSGLSENTPVFNEGDIIQIATDSVTFLNKTAPYDMDNNILYARENIAPVNFSTPNLLDNTSNLNVSNGNSFISSLTPITVGSVGASEFISDIGFLNTFNTALSVSDGQDGSDGASGQNGQNGQDGQGNVTSNAGNTINVDLKTVINKTFNIEVIDGNNLEIIYQVIDSTDNLITFLTLTTSNLTNILNTNFNNITNVENVSNIVEVITNNLHKTLDISIIEVSSLVEKILDAGLGITSNLVNGLDKENLLDLLNTKLGELEELKYGAEDTLIKITEKLENLGSIKSDVIENLYNLKIELANTLNDFKVKVSQVTDTITNPVVSETLDVIETATNIADKIDTVTDNLLDGLSEGNDIEVGLISPIVDPAIEAITGTVNELAGGSTESLSDKIVNISDLTTDKVDDLLSGIIANHNGGSADSDLEVTGDIDIVGSEIVDAVVDVTFDTVENLIGDLDIQIDFANDLLNNNNIDNNSGDEDVTVSLDNNIIDNDLLSGEVDIELDEVEALVGDVDLNLDLASNLFGDQADPLVDSLDGGTEGNSLFSEIGNIIENISEDIIGDLNVDSAIDLLDNIVDHNNPHEIVNTAWTESLANVTDLLDTSATGNCSDSVNLPDPLGTLSEGIGALGIECDSNLVNLGGLFG